MAEDPTGTQPNVLRAWLLAARPKTLTAAMTPVAVGTAAAYAAGSVRAFAALAALACALLIQIGTNLHNDVSDFERGADTAERLGPLRVTQAGLLTPRQVRRGAWLSFGAAGLVGLYLVALAGWPALLIGMLSIAAGLAYTSGPSPLAYNGLGDLFVMLFFGFAAVGGTALVQVGFVPAQAWYASLAVGATITALLVVNNVRDAATDRKSGRRTLPAVLGKRAGVIEFSLLLLLSLLAPTVMWLAGAASAWVLIVWALLPFAVRLARSLAGLEGRALNAVLGGISRFILMHGLLLTVGLALPV